MHFIHLSITYLANRSGALNLKNYRKTNSSVQNILTKKAHSNNEMSFCKYVSTQGRI